VSARYHRDTGRSGVLNRIRYFSWAAGYVLRTKVLRRRIPFVGGLVLTESCNLSCRQCRVANRGAPEPSFADALAGLDALRSKGIRSVAITGGEPFLWRDGPHRLEDVVTAARRKGFLAASVYTNGTHPIETSADAIFVGIDGLEETTRRLRADIFATVLSNIRRSSHPNILVNFSINAENEDEIVPFLTRMAGENHVRGVFFYFHTPYYGLDGLFLPRARRLELAENLIALKRRGLPVLNSPAALRSYIAGRWPRPSDSCFTYTRNRLFPCCPENGNAEACRECGYLALLEVAEIQRLSPSAILAGLKYLSGDRAGAAA